MESAHAVFRLLWAESPGTASSSPGEHFPTTSKCPTHVDNVSRSLPKGLLVVWHLSFISEMNFLGLSYLVNVFVCTWRFDASLSPNKREDEHPICNRVMLMEKDVKIHIGYEKFKALVSWQQKSRLQSIWVGHWKIFGHLTHINFPDLDCLFSWWTEGRNTKKGENR